MVFMKETPSSAMSLIDDGVRLFLIADFDGVFNPFYWSGTFGKLYFHPDCLFPHYPNPDYVAPKHWRDKSKEPKNYELQWSSELVENFNKILKDPRVQIIWLTTWRKHMADVVEKMGMTSAREMLYLPWGEGTMFTHDQFYKSRALRAFMDGVNNGDPTSDSAKISMLWMDDVVLSPVRPGYRDKMPAPEFDLSNSLLIAPNDMYGISRPEWDSIDDFTSRMLAVS